MTIRSEQAPGESQVQRTAVVRGGVCHTEYTIDPVIQDLLENAATGKLDRDTLLIGSRTVLIGHNKQPRYLKSPPGFDYI